MRGHIMRKVTRVRLVAWSLCIFLGAGIASAEELRSGFAALEITPPVGWRMYGYYEEVISTAVHDPLFVKAVVLEQGAEKVALVVCDLCFISRKLSETIRSRASALTGIASANIIVCATHTHNGPEYDGVLRDLRHERAVNEQGRDKNEPVSYFDQLSERCVQAIVEANQSKRPTRLQVVNAQLDNMAFNRRLHLADGTVVFNPDNVRNNSSKLLSVLDWKSKRFWLILAMPLAGFFFLHRVGYRLPKLMMSAIGAGMIVIAVLLGFWHGHRFPHGVIVGPAGPVDPDLPFLLALDARNNKPLGSLTVFAMHVATFGKNGQFSADFPAYLQSGLRQKFGDKFISLFGEGTAGDIGNIDFSGMTSNNSSNEPSRIGSALATTILHKAAEMQSIDYPDLMVCSRTVSVPLQEITPEQILRSQEILQKIDQAPVNLLVVADAWKVLNTEQYRKRFGANLPMEVKAIRIDSETAIVALPHEIFVELGLAIKRASPFKHTFVITLANDIDFYVPTRRAFAEGSYEVIVSSIKPGGGEMLVDATLEMLRELRPIAVRKTKRGKYRNPHQSVEHQPGTVL